MAAIALLTVSAIGGPAQGYTRSHTPAESSTSTNPEQASPTSVIPLSSLPVQAQDVHRRVLSGGPFRHRKDGDVFGNRERLLPRQTRGYYREYTVATPGERSRGARRLVCGGLLVKSPETCFYTADHYQSFQKIDPRR
jgi:ribonuclease T1